MRLQNKTLTRAVSTGFSQRDNEREQKVKQKAVVGEPTDVIRATLTKDQRVQAPFFLLQGY